MIPRRVRRRLGGRLVLDIVLVSTIAFLVVPLAVVFPVSVTPSSYFRFPPDGFSGRWYADFFGDEKWREAAWRSLRLAAATAGIATALAVLAALGVTRTLSRSAGAWRSFYLAPLVVPAVIMTAALYWMMFRLELASTFGGLLLGHVVLALPFAFIPIESTLRGFDRSLEDVAVSLGASRLRAFARITLPLVAPGVVVGAVFAFIASWDDVVVVRLLGSAREQTLPLRMLEFMTTQIRPTVAAVSSLLIVTLLAGMIGYQAWRYRLARRRAT